MDTEDRDHFKTIAGASVELSTGLATISARARSNSRPDLDFCKTKAKAICGCYRRDEAQDPDGFAAALAVVLSDYPAAIVEYAADPRTGVISKFPMGLPNVGQIKQYLDELHAKRERLQRLEALPKPERYRPLPLKKYEPNLFVPSGARGYERVAARAVDDPDRARFDNAHVCTDGVTRAGVWVPLGWWEVQAERPANKDLAEKIAAMGDGNGYSATADTAA